VKRLLPFLSLLIGIVGVCLALYFYSETRQQRDPVYYIGERATIIDASAKALSPIQVLYNGRLVTSTNVMAAVVYLWNDGKVPIRPDDVLEPLAIELGPSAEILESRVLHSSRPVVRFASNSSDAEKSSIPLSFFILEKNDGAAIQIIYAGKPDTPITMKGIVVGAGNPRLLSKANLASTRTPEVPFWLRPEEYVIPAFIPAFILLIYIVLVWASTEITDNEKRQRRQKGLRETGIVALLICLPVIAGLIYTRASSLPEVPQAIVSSQ
jgi:hypothetical protein